MLVQTEGQIFLSSKRGLLIDKGHRSLSTFSGKPSDNLLLCNDDTLKAGASLTTQASKDCKTIILPIVGAIELIGPAGNKMLIDVGQACTFVMPEGDTYIIRNPYEEEMVNFLQIQIATEEKDTPSEKVSFDLDTEKNTLVTIASGIHLGKFTGREELVFTSGSFNNGVFGFIIEGAFEFHNRLLETRDSVLLWNNEKENLQIEFEALSKDAIVLVIEVEITGEKSVW